MVSYHSINYSHVGEDKWRFLSYSFYFAELNSVQIGCIRVWDRSFQRATDRSILRIDRSEFRSIGRDEIELCRSRELYQVDQKIVRVFVCFAY